MNSKVGLSKGFPSPEEIHAAAHVYAGQLGKKAHGLGYTDCTIHFYTDEEGSFIYARTRLVHPTFEQLDPVEQKRISGLASAKDHKWLRAFAINDGRINSKTNRPHDGQFMPCEPDYKTVYPQGNSKKPLYRQQELATASIDSIIYVVEGEQKADALAALGITATTSGGSTSAGSADWQPLAGRIVRIWRDNDESGMKYQDEVKAVLGLLGCDVSIVDVDALGLQEKDDVVDWLAIHTEATKGDVLALPIELREQYARAGDSEGDSETPPNEETSEALALIEAALLLANDADNPDGGALWDELVLDAMRHIVVNEKSEWARLRYRLKICKAVKLSDLEAEILPKNAGQDLVSDASLLVEMASEKCTFVHDEDSEAFAIILAGNIRQCWRLQSKDFYEWLSHEFYKFNGEAPSDFSIKSTINSLSGKAKFEGEKVSIHVRIALHDGAYWLDLCNEAWQAVRITAQGWQVIDAPSVLFTRTNSMRPLPIPTGQGNLSALWQVVNVQEKDRLFVLTWMLECLRPETPFVVAEVTGEQGSAKSSTQSKIRDLIDPNKSNLRVAPKNKDDIFVGAKNSHLVSYENLSHLSADYQDALCTLATGGGYAGRTLYSNGDETVVELKKPIILNGINIVVTAQDLLDRTLHIDCPMLANTLSEVELDQYWQENYAAAFTGLLDAFVAALAQMPNIDLSDEKLPRMADFTKLGEAVYMAHAHPAKTFLFEYRERRKEGVSRTLEASPIALAMIAYLNRNPLGFNGTIGELLTALENFKEEGDTWVKSAKGLGDAIQRLKPAFRQIGILLDKDERRSMHGYKCTLRKAPVIYPQSDKLNERSTSSSSSTCEVHKTAKKQSESGGASPDYVHHELHVPANKSFNAERIYTPPESANDSELDAGVI